MHDSLRRSICRAAAQRCLHCPHCLSAAMTRHRAMHAARYGLPEYTMLCLFLISCRNIFAAFDPQVSSAPLACLATVLG